jgi:hypothetical protein
MPAEAAGKTVGETAPLGVCLTVSGPWVNALAYDELSRVY